MAQHFLLSSEARTLSIIKIAMMSNEEIHNIHWNYSLSIITLCGIHHWNVCKGLHHGRWRSRARPDRRTIMENQAIPFQNGRAEFQINPMGREGRHRKRFSRIDNLRNTSRNIAFCGSCRDYILNNRI